MKPAPFDYVAPDSIEGALAALSEYGGAAKILAGGQSLVPMLNFRLVRPAALIDLRHVPDMTGISLTDGKASIGAMTTHRAAELSDELIERCPLLGEALGVVGHVSIRNLGTVGGSMAHADPAAEWPTLALALDAAFTVTGPRGERIVGSGDFFTGWMSTSIESDELLRRIDITLPPRGAGTSFQEVSRRHGDFGLAGAAAVLATEDGVVAHARIALLGLGLTPVRATDAEDALLGREPTREAFKEAAEQIGAHIRPLGDQQATESYKRHLGGVLTVRALQSAWERSSRAETR